MRTREPVPLDEAVERVSAVRMLLSEVPGGLSHLTYVPTARERALGVAWKAKATSSPLPRREANELLWRAGALSCLKRYGPEHQRACLACYQVQPRLPWNDCPNYPVGALLAGVTGCDIINQPKPTRRAP